MKTYNFKELAPQKPAIVNNETIVRHEYGRLLGDFEEGQIFYHPRGFTIGRSFAQEFASTFHEANPLFLSTAYAKQHGFQDMLVSPLMVFNLSLSLGVEDNSEKALANLGYYNVHFLQPVYPNDTLRARTKVLSVRNRGEGNPGIVHILTQALNQRDEVVNQYERKIMISSGRAKTEDTSLKNISKTINVLGADELEVVLPSLNLPSRQKDVGFSSYTGSQTYFQNFKEGQIIVHKNMRTITDEHVAWTYRLGNTHPLHYDKIYSKSLSGKMSGEPIVYGGLVFAWLCGLASRDTTDNMLWDLGYTEGYHTQPAISGDTIGALSRVLAREEGKLEGTGEVQIQFIGVKNIHPNEALEKYGADLFIKENDKKDLNKQKISEKIFEIERRILIKK